jgi:hypothetical protein
VLAGIEGDGQNKPVGLTAVASAVPAALHAGALERTLFANIELIKSSPESWMEAVADPGRGGYMAHLVHGALAVYDLTDLAGVVRVERK